MGRRGVGARKKTVNVDAPKLRKRFPWNKRGLSKADQVIAFAEFCPVTSGSLAGTRFKLAPFQIEFIHKVFAETVDGIRHVRRAVLSLPRKCGKTGLSAVLCLAALVGPLAEARGQVVSAANDRAQAALIFSELEAMICAVPEFDALCNIRRFTREIEVLSGAGAGTIFRALSASAQSAHGLSPTLSIYDEFGQSSNPALYEALSTASGARENALCLVISTEAASDDMPLSHLIDYGRKVESGQIVDPAFHLTHYGAPAGADIYDPETWAAAIPALGLFRSVADVENLARSAREMPTEENAFRNLVLNMRVAAHARFIHASEWDACGESPPRSLEGRTCFGGLDLSWGRDLTALVLVFPDGDCFDVLCQFWLPSHGLAKKSVADRVPWRTWRDEGFLSDGGEKTVDPDVIARALEDANQRYDLRTVGFDRWGSAQMQLSLEKNGSLVELMPIGQGYATMNGVVRGLERHVAEGRLRHGMNPILRMCAANAVTESDAAGNVKLTKAKSSGRIDGLVALGMALHVAEVEQPEEIPAFIRQFIDA